MSDLDRRLTKVETSYQQPEAPRVLILDELPDGRLVDPFTRGGGIGGGGHAGEHTAPGRYKTLQESRRLCSARCKEMQPEPLPQKPQSLAPRHQDKKRAGRELQSRARL